MNQVMAAAWRQLADISDFVEGPSTFADDDECRAYWLGGRQIVNLYDRDHIELRLTRATINDQRHRLRADPRVQLRRNASDWLTVHVVNREDIALVVELARLAGKAHRALPARTGPPAPEGADLARRRRFH